MSNSLLFASYHESINRKEDPFDSFQERVLNVEHVKKQNYVEIRNCDLKTGTYCITKPGYYKLVEDIVFSPLTDEDLENIRDIHKIPQRNDKYKNNPAYQLGFFAAFTIETKNVVFDLNGKTISQGEFHHKLQRFYAHIELANSPFIKDQGPAKFGGLTGVAENVLIMNGLLGLSSHHGIHGNNNNNVLLRNISFFDFEVAAIALNGATNVYIKDCHVLHVLKNLMTNHKLSHVLFIMKHLELIMKRDQNLFINIENKEMTAKKLLQDIEAELRRLLNDPAYDGILKNHSGLSDGNCYGIVFNSKGFVVNEFKTLRDNSTIGNENIILEGVEIHHIISKPTEVIGLNRDEEEEPEETYTRGQFVGPVGDIFSYDHCLNHNGEYKSNLITNAQLFVQKHATTRAEKGTIKISEKLVEWAEMNHKELTQIMRDNNMYKVSGKDSMGHKMKGNIGLFISQGKNILIKNTIIDNVGNLGEKNQNSDSLDFAQSSGAIVAGSENVLFENVKIDNITSTIGDTSNIRKVNENKNIRLD